MNWEGGVGVEHNWTTRQTQNSSRVLRSIFRLRQNVVSCKEGNKTISRDIQVLVTYGWIIEWQSWSNYITYSYQNIAQTQGQQWSGKTSDLIWMSLTGWTSFPSYSFQTCIFSQCWFGCYFPSHFLDSNERAKLISWETNKSHTKCMIMNEFP